LPESCPGRRRTPRREEPSRCFPSAD
jgi:hypothetical protein